MLIFFSLFFLFFFFCFLLCFLLLLSFFNWAGLSGAHILFFFLFLFLLSLVFFFFWFRCDFLFSGHTFYFFNKFR